MATTELAMTDRDRRKLKTIEDAITNSGKIMWEGMREIHDQKLYRENYATWEDYCRERWGISRTYAERLIEHGKVLALLNDSPELKTVPIGTVSEAATRELNGLPDDKKVEVVKRVAAKAEPSKSGAKRITAAAVKAEVQHDREPGDESEPTGADPVTNGKVHKATADMPESYLDDERNEVPVELFPVWQQRDTFLKLANKIKTLSGEIQELKKSPAGRCVGQAAKLIEDAGKALAMAMPSVVNGKRWKSVGETAK